MSSITATVESWRHETIGTAAVKALQKNGFDALFTKTIEEASDKITSYLGAGKTVGFGGSMSIKALGIAEKASELGAVLLDHNAPNLSPEKKMEILRAQLTCDVFISGTNAVTLEGFLVNVDGNGNRVAALTFGPKKTIVVVGTNKIVRDLEEAHARIETLASPMNNKRLDKPNPCVKTGLCQDCSLETRICRIYQILKRRPSLSDFTVIVVGAHLGF
ncbi:MAG: lactate utilization protein [Termitinemataceae bacterium]